MIAAAFLISGCGGSKKDSKDKDAPGQNPLNAPTDYLGALNKSKKKAERTAVIVQTESAIEQFKAGEGRIPESLQELVDNGYLTALPKAPYKEKTSYDPKTGEFKVFRPEE